MKTTIQKYLKHKNLIDYFSRFPEREFTVFELSKEAKTPYSTTWRFVQLLDREGIIFTRKIGNYTVCKLNIKSPYLAEIKKIFCLAVSPQRAALREFLNKIKEIKEIKKAYLFGSVAKGEEKPESDVDTVLIVEKDSDKIKMEIPKIMGKILEESKIQIVPHVMTEKEFNENKSFKEEVKKGELIYERIR